MHRGATYYENTVLELLLQAGQNLVCTLGQLFCRCVIIASGTRELAQLADRIQKTIRIYDVSGNRMNTRIMDFARLDRRN